MLMFYSFIQQQCQFFLVNSDCLMLLLLNCSLNWQHQLCKNPRPNPDIKTLFVDHTCGTSSGAHAQSPVTHPLMGSIPKVGGFPPLGVHGVSQ
jgi:hypothetical protein